MDQGVTHQNSLLGKVRVEKTRVIVVTLDSLYIDAQINRFHKPPGSHFGESIWGGSYTDTHMW